MKNRGPLGFIVSRVISPQCFSKSGHSLIELLVVLSLLGLCFSAGGLFLSRGIFSVQARAIAQGWQAAVTCAQTGALWQGVSNDVGLNAGHISVNASVPLASSASGIPGTQVGDIGGATPPIDTSTNVDRWRQDQGLAVRFLGGTAYPNSAGSVFFQAPGAYYRVTVRMESGLTSRTRIEGIP